MPKKPRLGRPPLREADKRKHIMSIRVRPKLYEQIQAAAEKSGRTLSQEVETHLERIFYAASNEPATMDLSLIVGGAFRLAEVMDRVGDHFAKSDKPDDVERAKILQNSARDILKFRKEPPK